MHMTSASENSPQISFERLFYQSFTATYWCCVGILSIVAALRICWCKRSHRPESYCLPRHVHTMANFDKGSMSAIRTYLLITVISQQIRVSLFYLIESRWFNLLSNCFTRVFKSSADKTSALREWLAHPRADARNDRTPRSLSSHLAKLQSIKSVMKIES